VPFRINPNYIPRYQAVGTVLLVLFAMLVVGSYLLHSSHFNSEQQLAQLRERIVEQQKERLRQEVAATLDYIHYMNAQAESVLVSNSKAQVDEAIAVANSIYHEQQHNLEPDDLKQLIKEALRDVRFFNGRGYLFIDDMAGNCILLPTAPHLEGKSLYDNQDDTGHYIMRGLIDAVKNHRGEGISRYRWYAPGDKSRMRNKLAYVKRFEPFDWIIGTGDYLFQVENDLKQAALARLTAVRFGKNGYITVMDKSGRVLSNPGFKVSVGKTPEEIEDPAEREVVEMIIDKSRNGGGFIDYNWYLPDGRGPTHKISLVANVTLWDWIIVVGFYPEDIEEILDQQRAEEEARYQKDTQKLYQMIAVAAVLMLLLALSFSSWLESLFRSYQRSIEDKQKELEASARELKISAKVFDIANEGIMVTDASNKVVAINTAFTEITGYSAADVLGQNPNFMASGKHDESFYKDMWQTLCETGHWEGEVWNRRKGGECYPEWLSISVSKDGDGKVENYVATLADITERKQSEERLRFLAEYDPLTRLPNRRLLEERVNQAISWAKRHHDRKFAMLFIDLDRFKNINDSLGHGAGDQVLMTVAERLQECARETDTVSRLGGDEFVILLTDQDALTASSRVARRVIHNVSRPIEVAGHSLVVTPSVGIAMFPDDGICFEELQRNADAALYFAKDKGRNNFQYYTVALNAQVSERFELENALRKAIREEQFEVFFQPQYDLGNRRLTGCEALVRWNNPEQGLITPDRFIPLAEETGLILELGDWVMREACHKGVRWLTHHPDLTVAVNVSAYQFSQDLISRVKRALELSGFPAHNLVLEVTESTLMDDAEQTIGILQQLRELGIRIALDDFGTGYSSLAYLKRFPLDKLKIDRAFIDGLPADGEDVAITSSIIDVARNLRLMTVAEGIETEDQEQFLRDIGCDVGQGYLMSKPINASEMERMLGRELL